MNLSRYTYLLSLLALFSCTEEVTPVLPQQTTQEEVPDSIQFVTYETQPTYPGGMLVWNAYLKEHMVYPTQALANQVEGTVFLSFMVNKNGRLSDVRIIRGIGHGLDEEAMRLLKNSGNWLTGRLRGEPIRYHTQLRIVFRI